MSNLNIGSSVLSGDRCTAAPSIFGAGGDGGDSGDDGGSDIDVYGVDGDWSVRGGVECDMNTSVCLCA